MKKRNVCVVTWFGSSNFGTNLQAYALCHILKRYGYSVRILSSVPPFSNVLSYLYYFFSKSVLYKPWVIVKSIFRKKVRKYYYSCYGNSEMTYWVRSVLRPTFIYFSFQLKRLIKETDCFIVGSDQVWNTYVGFDPTMFLSFAGDRKRISYSSSIGAMSINPIYKDEMKKLLEKFSHISVRESSSVVILNELLGRNSVCSVLDPTLLLTQGDWISFSKPYKGTNEKKHEYVFCYMVGNNDGYERQIQDVLRMSGLKRMVIVSIEEGLSFPVEDSEVLSNVTPPEFVWLLNNAALICTDSFHATAMCINLKKPFVELLRFAESEKDSQNIRLYNLLNHYKLEDRLYNENTSTWIKDIDYSEINETLERDRQSSIRWLLDAIEN